MNPQGLLIFSTCCSLFAAALEGMILFILTDHKDRINNMERELHDHTSNQQIHSGGY